MITVIIAGGSGTRLWPLSTSDRPKQLLALTTERTMVQQAHDRAAELGETIYVVTEASHSDQLREQLPELPDDAFLVEPGRRGTAHCIIYALDCIARRHKTDEPIAFIHADHNVRDVRGFAGSFTTAAQVSSDKSQITLIGIEPTYAATGFGYIERGAHADQSAGVYEVASFKEKPDFGTAQKYMESGNYLWNCGYFVGSVDTFLNEISAVAPDLMKSYDKLSNIADFASDDYSRTYLELENLVIDTALIEKARSLSVVSADFDWMDIGSFKDLHDIVPKDEESNYCKGSNIHIVESDNAYVRNEGDQHLAVIGLDNVIVVNTPDGILVARKDVSHRVGDVAKKIQKKEN